MMPGSISASVGTLAPSEPGNIITDAAVEQGATIWHSGPTFVVAFAHATLRADTLGYSWNNTVPAIAGVKLVRTAKSGVAQLVTGFSTDSRSNLQSPIVYATYWTAWRGSRAKPGSGFAPSSFPGSLSASSGIVTPRESDNWTTYASAEQGAVVFTAKRVSGIPFVRAINGIDTRHYGWNNRSSVEAGGKLAFAMAGGVIEAGASRRYEFNRVTNTSTTAPVFFVNLWFGWNPRLAN